jgi:hypothetical protein
MLHYIVQNVVTNVSEKYVASISWQKTYNSKMLLFVNQTTLYQILQDCTLLLTARKTSNLNQGILCELDKG